MKVEELEVVYNVAFALWRNFAVPDNKLGRKVFDTVWLETLKPYPLKLIIFAMQEYAEKNNFCNIAQIGARCEQLEMLAEGLDVDLVIAEIDKSKSLTMYEENFEKMSKFAQKVCGSASWLKTFAESGVFKMREPGLRIKAETLLKLEEKERLLKKVKSIKEIPNVE
jgi:hypothetical protein